jgi:diguanylate cyclase (GGDEF)-like protein
MNVEVLSKMQEMTRLRVLIIEDDRDTAVFFNTVLSLVGFECHMTFTAKDALAHLANSEPDLVLLDLRLGYEIDGEDIIFQIRTNQRFSNTRVIVVTAYPSMAETITDLADLVLLKPVDVEQLRNLVERIGSKRDNKMDKYFRDPITGLFNQEFYLTQLEHAIERARRRRDYIFSTMVFSLDPQVKKKYKLSNNELNSIMVIIASRLTRYFRPTDTLARLYGETFATLHDDIKEPDDAEIITKRMLEKLCAPFDIREEPLSLSFSFGVVADGRAYANPLDILSLSEKKMEAVRKLGGNQYAIAANGDHE